jgi:hypothetical protein
MSFQESDFVDDIIQDNLPVHTEPPRDTFHPWHRVRKEYIRRLQWNELTARMVKRTWRRQLHLEEHEWSFEERPDEEKNLQLPESVLLQRSLNCLMIPGEDLLDIRALWRDIQRLNCWIRYLGFNESEGSNQAGTRIHVSNNAVTSLPLMVRDSCVVRDRFEAVARENSQAWRYLKQYGPYHVVNLDLCGSLFPNTAKDPQEYYNALFRLLAYQFESQKTEWLLFITTMVEPAVVQAENLKVLCGPTRENYHKHKEFADRVLKLLPAEAFPSAESAVNVSVLDENQMVQLFGVAFAKWLLRLCQKAQPQWTVAMRRSYRYSINEDKGAVMLSLAFEMKPNIAPPVDSTGMSKLELQPKVFPSELECAVKLAESVANIRDIDAELVAKPGLKAELQEAQASLLESAGYDRAAYLKWVSEGEITSSNKS